MVEYIVIEDAAGFLAACEALAAGTGPVAVDVERASGFRYSQRAYLIQVFRRDAGVFLFDPTTIDDFSPCRTRSARRSGSSTRPARICRRCASAVSSRR